MLPSTHRMLGTPDSAFVRMLRIFGAIVDVDSLAPGDGIYRKLLDEALERMEEPVVVGHMEVPRVQEQIVFDGLSQYRGVPLFILNAASPDRADRPARYGSDFFHPMNRIADGAWLRSVNEHAGLYEVTPEELLGSHVVMMGGIEDVPATTFGRGGFTGAKHLFASEIWKLDRLMRRRGKLGFGSVVRYHRFAGYGPEPEPLTGNSQYSLGILDFQRFKAERDADPLRDIDKIQETGDRQEFYEQQRPYIELNRRLVLAKNVSFLQELRPEKVYIYALQGSTTMELWARAAKTVGVPYKPVGGEDGVLQGKETNGEGELDETARGRLQGLILSRYNQRSGKRIVPGYLPVMPLKEERTRFLHCPWERALLCDKVVGCGGPQYRLDREETCLKTEADKLSSEEHKAMGDFAILTGTGILPIEGWVYQLNERDNELGFGDRQWKSWVLELNPRAGIVVPYALKQIDEPANHGIRISDLTYPISLKDFITKPGEQIELERQQQLERVSEALVRGRLWHRLMFEGEQTVYRDLLDQDFEMPRHEYCDASEGHPYRKHVVYKFTPTDEHLDIVRLHLEALPKATLKYRTAVMDFFSFVSNLVTSEPEIVLPGHPDSVCQIYRPDVPESKRTLVIIDGKTSTPSPYGNPRVLNQQLGYGNAVKQMHDLECDAMIAIALYPRFTPNRFLPPEMRDMTEYGLYLNMTPQLRKVNFGGRRDAEFHAAVLEQYAGRKYVGMII